MKKIVFIGDIHGQISLMRDIIKKYPREDYRRIWVGDFGDSYVEPIGNSLACYYKSLNEECVIGNHDYHYLYPNHTCSGYDSLLDSLLEPIKQELRANFKYYIYIKEINTLVTHAGVSCDYYGYINNAEIIEKLSKLTKNQFATTLALDVGLARGGTTPIGGPLWCDWNSEFKPIPDLNQVMGHTRIKKIEFTPFGINANIDCLEGSNEQVLVWSGEFIAENVY